MDPRPARYNPGWEHDQEIAARYATELAATLLTVIPVRALIAAWRAHVHAGGRDDPRQWLEDAGVLAGILVVLRTVLRQLWTEGWNLGVDSGNQLTGTSLDLGAEALDAMLGDAEAQRLEGMAGTRLGQIADLLEEDDGTSPAGELAQEIEQEIGSESRALMVTQTETTWSMAEGMLGVFYQAGATTIAWATARDGRVCSRCSANQGEGYIPAGESFPSGDTQPPAHPSCVIGSTRVTVPGRGVMPADVAEGLSLDLTAVSAGLPGDRREAPATAMAEPRRDFGRRNIRAVSDREYVGDVITIRTALGHELTVTPNHPVATGSGWVAAAELTVGRYVLSSTAPEWVPNAVHPDEDHIPPRIEQVAQTFPVMFGSVPLAAEDFHGDGQGSEVCVIRADGLLVRDQDAAVPEHVCQHHLGGRDVASGGAQPLDAPGAGNQALGGHRLTTDSIMRGLREPGSLSRRRLGHAVEHGLAAIPGRDSGAQETPVDGSATHAESGGKRLDAFASLETSHQVLVVNGNPVGPGSLGAATDADASGYEPVTDGLPADTVDLSDPVQRLTLGVTPDEVIHVERAPFRGHVYNLDSEDGWYFGNAILTHNCRCALIPGDIHGWTLPVPNLMMLPPARAA